MLAPLVAQFSLTLAASDPGSTAQVEPIKFWMSVGLMSSGIVIAIMVLFSLYRQRKSIQSPVEARAQAAASGAAPALQVSTGMTHEAERLLRLMGEAEELVTRLAGQLDDKAVRLERLMAQAEILLRQDPPTHDAASYRHDRTIDLPDTTHAREHSASAGAPLEVITRQVDVPAPAMAGPALAQASASAAMGFSATAPATAGRAPIPSMPSVHVPAQATSSVAPPMAAMQTRIAASVPLNSMSTVIAPNMSTNRSPSLTADETPRSIARTGATSPPHEAAAVGLEPLARQIYALSDQGFTPTDIASRLGQHTGKVELILALRGS